MQTTTIAFVLVTALAQIGCSPPPMPRTAEPTEQAPPPAQLVRAPGVEPGGSAKRYALLVGVTEYPNLGDRFRLEGPANDVVLVRTLLMERFGFAAENITTLAEAEGNDRRPTFANIKAAIEQLAKKLKADDQVVILLSGHGAQIPDQDPPQPDDPEPDGLDEAFLPADVAKWDGKVKDLPNAIRDDDLRLWVNLLTDRDAYVWVIADFCHSGTALRTTDDERPRKVTVNDLGIPAPEIAAAEARAAKMFGKTRGLGRDDPPFLKNADKIDRLVGVYACMPFEETVERLMPMGTDGAKNYGILTYTLCEVLTEQRQERPLTYRELVAKIDARYRGWNRNSPTPLAEGKGRDRAVLGVESWPNPPFRLARQPAGVWKVDGGRLHGLTSGSILAVYDPDGPRNRPVGHVRLTGVRMLEADAEPCEFEKVPTPKELPDRATCSPVFVDFGDLRVPVTIASRTEGGDPLPEADRKLLTDEVTKLAEAKGSIVALAGKRGDARWVLTPGKGGLYLTPTQGTVKGPGGEAEPRFGPFARSGDKTKLKEALGQIARAENLLRLTAAPEGERTGSGSRVQIEVEVLKYKNADAADGSPVGQGSILQAFDRAGDGTGDVIAFRVHNKSRDKFVYSTILFIDSGYKIECTYPEAGQLVQRLKPGDSFTTDKVRLRPDTLGVERVLVIATREPVDFSWLEQPSIEQAKTAKLRGEDNGLDTPLGRLLQNALFGQAGVRGLAKTQIEDYAASQAHWITVPFDRKSVKEK